MRIIVCVTHRIHSAHFSFLFLSFFLLLFAFHLSITNVLIELQPARGSPTLFPSRNRDFLWKAYFVYLGDNINLSKIFGMEFHRGQCSVFFPNFAP